VQDADEYDRFRAAIFEVSGYKTHEPEVDRFHASRAKTKIASSSARTSKSYAAWKDVYPDILYHGARFLIDPTLESQIIWIVPPNFGLAKEFDYAWEDLVERRAHLGIEYELIQAVKNAAQGHMRIQIRWGKNCYGRDVDTIVEVRSAANERQLQSEEVDIAILSEAARLPEIVWSKYLSTRVGRSVWATTPDIEAAWIYREIERGNATPSLSIESFTFTPRANPKYNYGRYWIEHQKAELRTDSVCTLTYPADELKPPSADNGHDCFDPMVECGAMKDPGFAEQFGGQWTFTRGRVVPLRRTEGLRGEPAHVIRHEPPYAGVCDIHIAFDYGYADPTVVGFWMVGPQQVTLRRSIYERGLTSDDVVARVDAILDEMHWRPRVRRMVGDPKKPEVVELFRRRGLPIWETDKLAQADRKAGHLEMMNFLATNPRTGEPYLLIHSDNNEVIEELDVLRYREKVRDPNAPSSFHGRDDAYDMIRYFVMSHPPVQAHDKVLKLEDTDFNALRRSILARQRNQRTVLPLGGRSGLAGMGL